MDIDVNAQPLPGMEQPEAQAPAEATPSITNLDSLSEFEFQGEKYTPERLQEMFKGYQSYQSVKGEDRFWQNLDTDLQSVLENPQLAGKFKSIYPEKFHTILDRMLRHGQTPAQTQESAQGIPKEFLNEFGQLKSGYQHMAKQLEQMSIESANAKLDAILPKLWEKYPMAVEDSVLTRAEAFINQGGKMTDAVWERFAKESHEALRKKADSHYKKELETQLNKSKQSADIGPGGAPAGKAPPKRRTFEDAREDMIKYAKQHGLTV